jgi:hypothetical protein
MKIGKLIALCLFVLLFIAGTLFGNTPTVKAAIGTVSIQPASGPRGTTVILTGNGYTPDAFYTITFNYTVTAMGVVPADGSIHASWIVSNLPRGNYEIDVTTDIDDTAYPLPVFVVTPQIMIDKKSGAVGDQIAISGNGFDSYATLTPYIDGLPADGYAAADSNGNFSGCFLEIPPATKGPHTITVDDGIGPSPGISFNVASGFSVLPNTVTCNSTFSMTGTGFEASSQLSLFLDNNQIPAALSTTDAKGTFTEEEVSAPRAPAGPHTLKVQDAAGNSAEASLIIQPSVTMTPAWGIPGDLIEISGDGFVKDVPITLTYNGKVLTAEQSFMKTDPSGSFQGNFIIPSDGRGSYPLIISDGTNKLNLDFSISSTATIDRITGMTGSTITITGKGFKAHGLLIISYDGLPVANANADAGGNFTATVTIGPSCSGEHQVTVVESATSGLIRAQATSDASQDGSASEAGPISFPFTVISNFKAGPLAGSIGTRVMVQGTGFMPNQDVSIKYDSTDITSGTADSNGTFTAVLEAPVSKGGDHLVTVTDGVNTGTFTFVMESDPPSAPTHFSPSANVKTEPAPAFAWEDVTDPSGVTYAFQLARDIDFADIVLEEKELTTTSYQLDEEQTLKKRSAKAPYYWRVKATDVAYNEGQWSEPQSFYVGFTMPTFAYFILAGIGAFIVGMIAYFIGKRNGRAKISPEG